MKQKWLKKSVLLIGILILFSVVMLVLDHSAKNGRETTEHVPDISDTPVYVECVPNEPVEVKITMKEDLTISGLRVFLVNLSSESRGSLYVSMKDSGQNVFFEQTLPVNTIVPGEWFTVAGEAALTNGEIYTVTFLPDGCDPYFMQVQETAAAHMPFTQEVAVNGQTAETGISMGVNSVTPVELTFGEIFYYSVPFSVAALIVSVLFVLLGRENIFNLLGKIPAKEFFGRFGNDLFLVLIFIFSCMGVYAEAYVKGVYITSDSAGYLREAVNIVNGNGFHYDGLAGYDHWFANWPVIYPVMIAGVMLVTGMNAYLASKIVTMIMVGLILLVLRFFYKNEAWIYALCLLNFGFVSLTYYTWSEIPFMLFLILFVMLFAKIVSGNGDKKGEYIGLGVAGLCCFLTRYFGIYVWIVTGGYILFYGYMYYKKQEKIYFRKAAGLTVTAMISGILSMGYLLMNKIMNGKASGVSRTLWWDDYEVLTDNLIQSLLTEICNVFSIAIPDFMDAYPYNLKVLLLIVIIALLAVFVKKTMKWESVEAVMVAFGVCYYVIFIAIRYVSSMDLFYFRFFEPGSFLICLGLFGALLPFVRKKAGMPYLQTVIAVFMVLSMATMIQNEELDGEQAYYHELTAQWDSVYEEIPEKSVVIFSDLDFRSSYYRPDVIGGELRPEHTFEQIKEMYAGSDYLCIKKEYVQTMLESGEYELTTVEKLQEALDATEQNISKKLQDNMEYAIINLRFAEK